MKKTWFLLLLSSFLAAPWAVLAADDGKAAPKPCPLHQTAEGKNLKCKCKSSADCPCDCGCRDKKEAEKPAPTK